jgi:hypothetical protein
MTAPGSRVGLHPKDPSEQPSVDLEVLDIDGYRAVGNGVERADAALEREGRGRWNPGDLPGRR